MFSVMILIGFFFPCLVLGLNMLGQFQMQKTVFVEQHKKKLLRVFNFETSTCHVNILTALEGTELGSQRGFFCVCKFVAVVGYKMAPFSVQIGCGQLLVSG